MTYPYSCQVCGPVSVQQSIHDDIPQYRGCPRCGYAAKRIYDGCMFTEDRLHFRKTYGTPTDNWSYALHAPMPESRRERKIIERQRGIEFTTELTSVEKTRIEYAKHVETGGDRCMTAEQLNPYPTDNVSLVPKLLENLRKDNTITVNS